MVGGLFANDDTGRRTSWLNRRYKWLIPTFLLFLGLVVFSLPSQRQYAKDLPSKFSQKFTGRVSGKKTANLHLLVPATSSNKNLCRCLLSIVALGYPTPVLINWGNKEAKDPYVQHLGKVGGILDHLDILAEQDQDDLVLVVDGYDLWFQLRPEVLINRYFKVIRESNDRIATRFGSRAKELLGIYSSILLGQDKINWPEDPDSPKTWAVPDSTLPPQAFGPDTDLHQWRNYNRPQWLNSGTIMGPVKDVQALLKGTLARIEADGKKAVKSDQHYMSLLYSDQEYARTLKAEGPLDSLRKKQTVVRGYNGEFAEEVTNLTLPMTAPELIRDYHIAIDYESAMFQTMAYYRHFLGWQTYDGENVKRGLSSHDLAEDIAKSPPPLPNSMANNQKPASGLPIPSSLSWRDIALGTNTVTQHIFPILHFTPPKEYINIWWPRMWYYPYGESIIRQADKLPRTTYGKQADGREWWPFAHQGPVGAGGFTPKWDYLGWDDLCQEHEPGVFTNARKEKENTWPPSW